MNNSVLCRNDRDNAFIRRSRSKIECSVDLESPLDRSLQANQECFKLGRKIIFNFLSFSRVRSGRFQLLLATIQVEAAKFGYTFILNRFLRENSCIKANRLWVF